MPARLSVNTMPIESRRRSSVCIAATAALAGLYLQGCDEDALRASLIELDESVTQTDEEGAADDESEYTGYKTCGDCGEDSTTAGDEVVEEDDGSGGGLILPDEDEEAASAAAAEAETAASEGEFFANDGSEADDEQSEAAEVESLEGEGEETAAEGEEAQGEEAAAAAEDEDAAAVEDEDYEAPEEITEFSIPSSVIHPLLPNQAVPAPPAIPSMPVLAVRKMVIHTTKIIDASGAVTNTSDTSYSFYDSSSEDHHNYAEDAFEVPMATLKNITSNADKVKDVDGNWHFTSRIQYDFYNQGEIATTEETSEDLNNDAQRVGGEVADFPHIKKIIIDCDKKIFASGGRIIWSKVTYQFYEPQAE